MKKQHLAVLALCTFFGIRCTSNAPEHFKRTFLRMDTVVNVTVVADRRTNLNNIWSRLDSLLKDWEERFSQTHERSEVRVLNENAGQAIPASADLFAMLSQALSFGDSLDGAFDLTILPLKELWGFGEHDSELTIPTDQQLAQVLESVDRASIMLDRESKKVRLTGSDVMVDVGGIAKGFALQRMAQLLDSLGVMDYLVVAGGDIVSHGSRKDGKSWRIGIQHPRQPGNLLATLPLDSGSIVTSGDYERYYEKDGVRYHHIFDPATGQSCRTNQSLTIWSMDPVEADVLSTGLFCRSRRDIFAYIDSRDNLECLVVDSAGESHISGGLIGKVSLSR